MGGIKVSIVRKYLHERGKDERPYIANGFLTRAGLALFNAIVGTQQA